MEQEDNRGVENVPATRIVYLGESNKKPLFGTQCCRVAGISMVNLTRAVISYTSSLAVYLLPNTNSPQTNIRRTSLVFGITDHMSRDQRASGNSKVSSLPERPALWECFLQRLTGSARGITVEFSPDVAISLWLLPGNKPLIKVSSFSYRATSHFSSVVFCKESSTASSKTQPLPNKQTNSPPKKLVSLFWHYKTTL